MWSKNKVEIITNQTHGSVKICRIILEIIAERDFYDLFWPRDLEL